MSNLVLPVSLGEALDKLTILDIKVSKINDVRKDDCIKEYNVLYESLKDYVESLAYFYKILKEINLTIWNLQENIHNDKNLNHTYGQILKENDRRFRVKKQINNIANSDLKEQKGYAKTKAFVYSHLGLGDHFWMNGAVRYLATCYDQILVVVKKNNEATVRSMYADDPSILFQVIDDDSQLHPFSIKKHFLIDQGYNIYSCGYHTENPNIYDFPYSFYDDMGLAREIRTSYFHIPVYQESVDLYNSVKNLTKEYILLHEQSSQKTLDIYSSLNQSIPILDINKNHYNKDHIFYEIAELVINKPMIFYKNLIEAATEVHCLESSFYCFASHLDLSKVEKKICYLPHDDSANRIGVFSTGVLTV